VYDIGLGPTDESHARAAQASMPAVALRSRVFGREHAVARMHLAYDRSSGFAPDDQEGRYDRE